jgi:hypothetical protein
MSKVIYRETVLVMNAHLFRHFAGMLYLRQRPGAYEAVRRLLGHRKLDTTTSFYTDFESKRTIRHYDEVVCRDGENHDQFPYGPPAYP